MKCVFKCTKAIFPDDVRVDSTTGATTPIGGRYNRPVLDKDGQLMFRLVPRVPPMGDGPPDMAVITEQGTFVQAFFDGSGKEPGDCHEREAHASLFLGGITEAAAAELGLEPGAEYDVVITKRVATGAA